MLLLLPRSALARLIEWDTVRSDNEVIVPTYLYEKMSTCPRDIAVKKGGAPSSSSFNGELTQWASVGMSRAAHTILTGPPPETAILSVMRCKDCLCTRPKMHRAEKKILDSM